MLRSLILISIYCLSVYSSCNKSIFCNQNTYSFRANFTASPEIDSIALSDTVWFTMDESVQLQDLSTNNLINFSNAANLSFVFGIHKVISATVVLPAADSFHYFIKKGVNVSAIKLDVLREFKLVEEAGRYRFCLCWSSAKSSTPPLCVVSEQKSIANTNGTNKISFALSEVN